MSGNRFGGASLAVMSSPDLLSLSPPGPPGAPGMPGPPQPVGGGPGSQVEHLETEEHEPLSVALTTTTARPLPPPLPCKCILVCVAWAFPGDAPRWCAVSLPLSSNQNGHPF